MGNSMTGYGRDVLTDENTTVTVEIRTVNHRFLDFSAKIPRSLLFLEDKIRKIIQSYFQRGRIEVYIGIEGEGFVRKHLKTDWDLLEQYVEQLTKVKNIHHIPGEIPISVISSMPELISVEEMQEHPDGIKDAILNSTKNACEQVVKMRNEEGTHLIRDIVNIMETMQTTVSLLHSSRSSVIEEYRERIHNRLKDYLNENIPLEDSRIYQEIALLAEKGDITEEITRLQSHIDLFKETIKQEGTIGRKLDFISQEMHREANTIGSKSTDAKIGEWVVSLKGDIEKIKEQIQNIE
ncbi:YicC/YloC family endoribonuclease [Virgibacillus byunsanensis]|uniref:YicC/YloC family endoribonuclease n=1 Tax=Virgibacillus byunsanensis TaxID=570945 RepID=A0ABW3LKK4_9BACI